MSDIEDKKSLEQSRPDADSGKRKGSLRASSDIYNIGKANKSIPPRHHGRRVYEGDDSHQLSDTSTSERS